MQGVGDDQIELIQFEPSWRPIKPIGKQYRHHLISSHQSIEPWQKSRTRKKERNQMRQQKGSILKGLSRELSTARRTESRRRMHQISKVKKGVTSQRCLRRKLHIKLVTPHLHPTRQTCNLKDGHRF